MSVYRHYVPEINLEVMAEGIIKEEDATDRIIIDSYEDFAVIDRLCLDNIKESDYYDFLCGNLPLPHIEIIGRRIFNGLDMFVEIKACGEVSVDSMKLGAVGVATIIIGGYKKTGFITRDSDHGLGFLSMDDEGVSDQAYQRLSELFTTFIVDYIGIQLAMLHPEIKNVFRVDNVPVGDNGKILSKKAIKRNRVVRYVKVQTIDSKRLRDIQSKRSFTRHCKAWFVLGHWRQYKDGHRTFIQGYWKGPLREYKRNFDNVRIREVN